MNKMYEFDCPTCGLDHVENGGLISKDMEYCPLCAESGKEVYLNLKYPIGQIENDLHAAKKKLVNVLSEMGLSDDDMPKVSKIISESFSSVIDACSESLSYTTNETTESDVVWIELENAQQTVNRLKSIAAK